MYYLFLEVPFFYLKFILIFILIQLQFQFHFLFIHLIIYFLNSNLLKYFLINAVPFATPRWLESDRFIQIKKFRIFNYFSIRMRSYEFSQAIISSLYLHSGSNPLNHYLINFKTHSSTNIHVKAL